MKLSVPYNYDLNLAQEIAEKYREDVDELYLPASQTLVGSGRPHKQPENYDEHIATVLDLMHKHGIKVNMLINGQCEGLTFYKDNNMQRLLDYIRFYRDKFGLDSITVIDLIHLQDIKKYIPDIEIQTSVNLTVNTVQKALYLKELGVKVITIDKEINKNLNTIRKIKNVTGLSLRMLVNDSCLPDCPFRIQHANAVSHVGRLSYKEYEEFGKEVNLIFFLHCGQIYQKSPWLFFKSSFIRPDDIKHYEGIVDSIKISDRMGSTRRILNIIESYSRGKYSGDLLDLIFVGRDALRNKGISIPNEKIPDDFFDKTSSCSRDCIGCNYCRSLFETIMSK